MIVVEWFSHMFHFNNQLQRNLIKEFKSRKNLSKFFLGFNENLLNIFKRIQTKKNDIDTLANIIFSQLNIKKKKINKCTFGRGAHCKESFVMMPSVPSEPMKSCFKSYPVLSLRRTLRLSKIVPSANTWGIICKLCEDKNEREREKKGKKSFLWIDIDCIVLFWLILQYALPLQFQECSHEVNHNAEDEVLQHLLLHYHQSDNYKNQSKQISSFNHSCRKTKTHYLKSREPQTFLSPQDLKERCILSFQPLYPMFQEQLQPRSQQHHLTEDFKLNF